MKDIVDAIDLLIDESLKCGPIDDYNVNRYDRCPKCNRDWHGMPITGKIAAMYERGVYDDNYAEILDSFAVIR